MISWACAACTQVHEKTRARCFSFRLACQRACHTQYAVTFRKQSPASRPSGKRKLVHRISRMVFRIAGVWAAADARTDYCALVIPPKRRAKRSNTKKLPAPVPATQSRSRSTITYPDAYVQLSEYRHVKSNSKANNWYSVVHYLTLKKNEEERQTHFSLCAIIVSFYSYEEKNSEMKVFGKESTVKRKSFVPVEGSGVAVNS